MSILGTILTLVASLGYIFRYSFVKDLNKYNISKESVNFYYRIVSFPFILLIAVLFKENLLAISPQFILWFLATLFVNVFFGIYQVHVYQKHNFSSVEGLAFLEILFTTVSGALFFNEILSLRQFEGIAIIILAFILLTFFEMKKNKLNSGFLEVLFYYLFVTAIILFNKQAILLSSPFKYAVYLTSGLVVANYLIIFLSKKGIYRLENKKANKLLVLVGLMAAISFVSINFGYKLLPVGIVSSILSLKIFISLWLSHKKYAETDLLPKVVASVLACVGVVFLFF